MYSDMENHDVDFYPNLGCNTHLEQQESSPQPRAHDGTPTHVSNIWTYVDQGDFPQTLHNANAPPQLLINPAAEQGNYASHQRFSSVLQHWPPNLAIPNQSMSRATYGSANAFPIANYTPPSIPLQQRSWDVSRVQGPFVPTETSPANSSDAGVITGIRGSVPFTPTAYPGGQAIGSHPAQNSPRLLYVSPGSTNAVTGQETSVFQQASSSNEMCDSSNRGAMPMPRMSFGNNGMVETPYVSLAEFGLAILTRENR
ncbi:hypothetical protein APHAL10511_008674 [Amanita phalloides]|nr:hypothetical protein APHAL10511_008674 [Amanita phalloides]